MNLLNQKKRWTPEEDHYLLSVYSIESINNIAFNLKRSPSAIESRYRHLQIKQIIISRNIKELYHFSDFKNHESIMKNGILSNNYMKENNIKYELNDEYRVDFKLDYICLSVSDYNKRLFYAFKYRKPNSRWFLYAIDVNVIFQNYCFFYSTNAAFKNFRYTDDRYLQSPEAFSGMFDEQVLTASGPIFRSSYPFTFKHPYETTCNQAEILIKDKISKKRILNFREIL